MPKHKGIRDPEKACDIQAGACNSLPIDNPATKSKKKKFKGLPRGVRSFILKSAGRYHNAAWISEELERRWNIKRSPDTIRSYYLNDPGNQPIIQGYRDEYNDSIADEPLMSKRYVLSELHDTIQAARSAGEYGATARLWDRALEVNAMKSDQNNQINHNVTGGITVDQRLAGRVLHSAAPTPELQGHEPLLIPENARPDYKFLPAIQEPDE